ncbi:MAG: hypothetical protein CMP59_09875 [Flavobacteriales bacterium]|nr:hypothetical protein [Flavobacteriales bacterium]|tara:strand:+ start:502 stop:1071 length:570 start_codon:yes stop_codon:yes gene_type:complete
MELIFDKSDIHLMIDSSLIERKNNLIKQFIEILAKQADLLQSEYGDAFALSPSAKVNRGENYKGFPYLVMDYPRLFSKKHVFAYRTLFWWGHFVSCTLHLKGSFLADFSNRLPKIIKDINASDLNFRVSTSGNEWNHHALSDEYAEVDKFNLDEKVKFFKLTSILPLEEINKLQGFLKSSHQLLLKPLV